MNDDYEYEYEDGEDEASLSENKTQAKRVRPKVNSTWTTAEICKLIALVKKETCIWDVADSAYANKQLKKNAWSRVSEGLDSQYRDSEMHAKWSNLRIQYRINQRKARTSWRFFNALSFLTAGTAAGSPCETKAALSLYNSSVEDSNDSASNTNLPATSTTHSMSRRTASAGASTRIAEQSPAQSPNRDEALATYLLCELRSLPERDANILRCRLQRTLLEFNEERQTNMTMDCADFKYA
ncbi:hypothetical protein KR222_002902 [Zaprionus bogoriensis]|nr:hypothetical protein KR222_002902 [Zaprionus bogoriensis]